MSIDIKTLGSLVFGSKGDDPALSQTELLELAGGAIQESQNEAYEHASFDDLTTVFPDIFARTNLPGTLKEFDAMDVIRAVEERGRRPEDIEIIKEAIVQNHEAWTLPALFRFEKFLRRTHITPHGTVFAKDSRYGENVKVLLPSVDDLISGRVPLFAFSRAIKDIRDRWFGGDLEKMASHMSKTMSQKTKELAKTLAVYAAGGLPEDYAEVYRLGAALKLVEVDGLANAWFADMYARHVSIRFEDSDEIPNLTFEHRRMDILGFAAEMKLGKAYKYDPRRSVHADMAGRAFHAIKAGFDVRTVVETYAEYAADRKRFLDNSVGAAKKLIGEGEFFAASFVLQMAAHIYRKNGDTTKAAVLTTQAGDALLTVSKFPKEFKNGGPSGDAIGYARQIRVELYKQALLDDAKGRVANGLPIGPNADYRFKKEILMRLAQLKEGYVDEPTAEMFNRAAKASGDDGAKKPVVILRKKGGMGSGSGSAGGNGGVKEIVTKEANSLSDANAPVAHASEEAAPFGDTVIVSLKGNVNDFVASLSPEQKVAIDYFKGSSAFLWQDIVEAQRVDLVIRAMNAASSNLGGAPSPVVFGAALTRLAENVGMMDIYGAYMLDGAGKRDSHVKGAQQQSQQFLYAPGATPKVGY